MTFPGDPHRVLGVGPGASLNEIRSAYRRLVKQWHPDAAGDRALPRFLAIQAAYEQLVDGEGRLRPPTTGRPHSDARGGGAGPGGGGPSGAGRTPGARPSSADPGRARASRDAWRARRAGWATGAGGGTGGGTSGGGTSGAGTTGGGTTGGGTTGAGSAGAGTAGAAGERPGEGGAGAGSRSGGAGARGDEPGKGPRERRAHHRTTRKATPGSTTYDEAAEPLDPAWGGAGWYGASSGTYWTINPREYADPRKHGPEYLARARRAAGATDGDPAAPGDPFEPGAPGDPGGAGYGEAPGGPEAGPARGAAEPGAAGPRATATGETDAAGSGAWRWSEQGPTTTQGDPHDWGAHGWSFAADPAAEPGRAPAAEPGRAPGERPRSRPASRPAPRPHSTTNAPTQGGIPDLEPYLRRAAPANLRRLARGPDRRWRLVLALVAWPPIGVAAASLIDLLTGCGAFAAGCSEPARFLPVAAQPLIVLVLTAIPALAASAAFAGLVALASALPAATIIAFASRWQPEAARALLALVVAGVYLVALLGPGWRERGVAARRPTRPD